jgi:2-oxoglutarate dehydrogenase E2 component (dihydrolipoamide succinyltransferase)
MPIELKVPSVGESITEVQIGQWHKREGEWAKKDESLVEIESEKATVEVTAPTGGAIAKVLKRQGETAKVGEVIGYLEESAAPGGEKAEQPAAPAPKQRATSERRDQSHAPAKPAERETRVMPAARRILAEHGLQAEQVQPSGPGGRLLKEDVERHVAQSQEEGGRREGPQRAERVSAAGEDGRQEEAVPMSPIRRKIAERLVEAQQTAALLTTVNEIDMSAVMALRQAHRDAFQQKYDVKLGFMSFFVKAAVDALKQFPAINAEIRDQTIVYRNYYDIGIAVSGKKGLVVPVLRNAERMSFAEIEVAIGDFGERAQANKLTLEELEGGTFTISNGGIFGSLLSTPIVNPPQSGILGMHAIQDRPVARDGQVVIRPMMYVALTYDHRLVDGREAVTFLRRIKEVVEEPARMLIEV